MDFLEITLLNGNKAAIRKDLVLEVMRLIYVSKEALKERPFLKDALPCTMVLTSLNGGDYYCVDSYESVMEKLRGE